MQSEPSPSDVTSAPPATSGDRRSEDTVCLWDDWATEHRAQLLLADALAACVPNERGAIEADIDALGRLEAAYNRALARGIIDAAESASRTGAAYRGTDVAFGKRYAKTYSQDFQHSLRAGWSTRDPVQHIQRALMLPSNIVRAHYVLLEGCDPTWARCVALLPPGPHEGHGWFDMIVSTLVRPKDDPDHGARPLDAPLCTASIALAQTLVSLGDGRTAPYHTANTVTGNGVKGVYQCPPTDRGEWSTTRAELDVFVSMMRRVHATWSLYLPLVAPTEHAINCALMPDIVE